MNKIDASEDKKSRIIERAMKSGLLEYNSISADAPIVVLGKEKPLEMPVIDFSNTKCANACVRLEKSTELRLLLECEAINRFASANNFDLASRLSEKATQKANRKEAYLIPAVLRYWRGIFKTNDALLEGELIDRLLADEMLDPSPTNNTQMLNEIFRAEYNGYLSKANSNSREYQISINQE